MGEVRLNVCDYRRALCGTIHDSVVDSLIAALSAEPETIAELEAAVARFIKPLAPSSLFAGFRPGVCAEAWDAGVAFLNLAARVVCVESVCSSPRREGEVRYHDGVEAAGVSVPYRVPDDWLFLYSVPEYERVAQRRQNERAARPPLDARTVLYDRVLDVIIGECLAAREAMVADPVAEIHARWLLAGRDDLGGQSPREVLLAAQDCIDFDLHSRQVQWSITGECPPSLATDAAAYRFAGFGTHEIILYYELVRRLLEDCWRRVCEVTVVDRQAELVRLQGVKRAWLADEPDDGHGFNPGYIIDCERRRLPLAVPAGALIMDDDCPLCETLALEGGPVFYGLDGCNMDEEFAFSFCRTRDEWEAEQRRRSEFDRRFARDYEEGRSGFARDSDEPLVQ